MNSRTYCFASESVSEGHPDKIADQISDAILDECLKQDKHSRVACETLVKNDLVILAGEITSKAQVDFDKVVRQVVSDIGYNEPGLGFSSSTCNIEKHISQQSPDISMGVTETSEREQGAGDQGLMFGFACDETAELMPLPISLSHKLVYELAVLRKSGSADFLKPDAKSQVSVNYVNDKPHSIRNVVISTQHSEDMDLKSLETWVVNNVIRKVIPSNLLNSETKFYVNPTGRFVIGGPVGDCGLTGRKIIVDTYGGYSRHGGGAFSGKDASKVDRSAAYAVRHVAKNIVASGVASKCEVQVAYAIGVARPVSLMVDTFGTSKVPEQKIADAVCEVFDLTPRGIIRSLDLLRPIYRASTNYGHFGRTLIDRTLIDRATNEHRIRDASEGAFPWEKLDKVDALKEALL